MDLQFLFYLPEWIERKDVHYHAFCTLLIVSEVIEYKANNDIHSPVAGALADFVRVFLDLAVLWCDRSSLLSQQK